MTRTTEVEGAVIREGNTVYVTVTADWKYANGPEEDNDWYLKGMRARETDRKDVEVELTSLEQELFAEELRPENF